MKIYKILLITAAVLLFIATLAALFLPYDFFTFLRIIICCVAIYSAIQARNSVIPLIGLLMVAVIFNPFAPIDLPQTAWRIIDLATAAAFIRLAIKPLHIQNQG